MASSTIWFDPSATTPDRIRSSFASANRLLNDQFDAMDAATTAAIAAAVPTSIDWSILVNIPDPIGQLAVLSGTRGDLVYYDGANWTMLPVGATGQALVSDGTAPAWTTVATMTQAAANPSVAGVTMGDLHGNTSTGKLWWWDVTNAKWWAADASGSFTP